MLLDGLLAARFIHQLRVVYCAFLRYVSVSYPVFMYALHPTTAAVICALQSLVSQLRVFSVTPALVGPFQGIDSFLTAAGLALSTVSVLSVAADVSASVKSQGGRACRVSAIRL
jgi:hypothetical protein